ncbi:hypothetical protein ABZ485_28060 [Streptomyces albogriseolus]|uniref:hypothetical protein n=1 Tax=Streptomyces albogriseolus TaxID=1887 RepID=UPI003460D331
MSTEDSSTAPVPRDDNPVFHMGLDIAMQWGQALGGPEQLKIAFEALEPQLRREHEIRLKQLEAQAKKAENAARAAREKRQHRLRMTSLLVGAVISIAMLAGGIYVAKDAWWLATLLCGPSLIGMMLIIVLRRHDAEIMRGIADAARRSTNAAGQANQPPPPV